MRLVLVTDLHGRADVLEAILDVAPSADAILLGGDLTNFGSADEAERIVRLVQRGPAPIFAVAGNCDSPEIDGRLARLGVSLMGRGEQIGSVGLCGVSAMPPWHDTMYELTEDEIAAALDRGRRRLESAERLVVLAHPPPHGMSLDCTAHGQHAGSTALRAFIERNDPDLVVCGHIHEARGFEHLGRSLVVNCGPAFRGCYAVAELDNRTTVQLCDLSELPAGDGSSPQ